MTPHVQPRVLACKAHGIVEGGARGHQSCSSENTVAMRLDNARVHIAGESEIIRVDNQSRQKMLNLMRRNFFGFARKSLNSS